MQCTLKYNALCGASEVSCLFVFFIFYLNKIITKVFFFSRNFSLAMILSPALKNMEPMLAAGILRLFLIQGTQKQKKCHSNILHLIAIILLTAIMKMLMIHLTLSNFFITTMSIASLLLLSVLIRFWRLFLSTEYSFFCFQNVKKAGIMFTAGLEKKQVIGKYYFKNLMRSIAVDCNLDNPDRQTSSSLRSEHICTLMNASDTLDPKTVMASSCHKMIAAHNVYKRNSQVQLDKRTKAFHEEKKRKNIW